jgi:hypothetical protein
MVYDQNYHNCSTLGLRRRRRIYLTILKGRAWHSGLTPGNNIFPKLIFFPKIIDSHLYDSIFEFGSIISKFLYMVKFWV